MVIPTIGFILASSFVTEFEADGLSTILSATFSAVFALFTLAAFTLPFTVRVLASLGIGSSRAIVQESTLASRSGCEECFGSGLHALDLTQYLMAFFPCFG